MKTNEIVAFYFDTPQNYHLSHTQDVIGKRLYKDTILVSDKDEFKKEYDKLEEGTPYILICHVFHSEDLNRTRHTGYKKFRTEGIEEDFNIEAILVSSGDSGYVMKNIFSDEHDNKPVYSYNKIHENVRNNKFKINYKGEGEIRNSNAKQDTLKKGIFLSHSSKDSEVVNKFRELILESGLGYNPNLIKFTSTEDHGIPSGINIPADLRDFINNEMGLFIQFLTPNYKKSRVCLNEEGAGWCILDDQNFIPIIIPPSTSKLISWVKSTNKGIKINEKGSLVKIYEDRKIFFGEDVSSSRFFKKIDEFIEFVNDLSKE